MDPMTVEIKLGTLAGTVGSMSLDLRVSNDGTTHIQIYACDPSDRRRSGTIVWLDPKQYVQLKEIIARADSMLDSIHKKSSMLTDLLPPLSNSPAFQKGQRVRVTSGTFGNFEGTVLGVNGSGSLVSVELVIFNKPTCVDFELNQLELC